MDINGKSIILTGAGSGIGRALAQALSNAGAKLVLADLNGDGLEETKSSLAHPDACVTVVGDITQAETRDAMRSAAEESFGGLDVLVNNAGVVAVGPLAKADDNPRELMARGNLLAPMQLIRDRLGSWEKSTTPTIVNSGSMFGDIACPLFAGYSATKFRGRGLAEALRREVAPKNVRVLYVAPRAAKTAATGAFEHLIEPMQKKLDEPEAVTANMGAAIRHGARPS